MKKLAILALLASATLVQASSDNFDMDKDSVLRAFVTHLNYVTKAGVVKYSEEAPESYKEQRKLALDPMRLAHVSLDSKYNLIVAIHDIKDDQGHYTKEQYHVAEIIYSSVLKTIGARPEVLRAMMKTFLTKIKPEYTPTEVRSEWATYVTKQARNAVLDIGLRKKFAKLYSMVSASDDREEFELQLLKEIKTHQLQLKEELNARQSQLSEEIAGSK